MARKPKTNLRVVENEEPAGEGHNNGFPSHSEIQMAVNDQVAWNLKREKLNAEIGAFRKKLKAKGITLGILDEKVRQLEWSPEEIKADREEKDWYSEAMRFPVGAQLEFFGGENTPDSLREQLRWRNIGFKDGLAGRGWPNEAPDGCGPDCRQSYAEGHDEGQATIRRAFVKRNETAALSPEPEGDDDSEHSQADGEGAEQPEDE